VPKSASLWRWFFHFFIASVGDAYNEGEISCSGRKIYKKDNGCYPERICADRIYINRENRHFCIEKRESRLFRQAFGASPKNPELNAASQASKLNC